MVQLNECRTGSQDALYLEDTYLTDVHTSVTATGRDETGGKWLAVRHNLFHPQGGGQPADRGWLADCEIVPVRDAATGLVVLHPIESSGTGLDDLSEGDPVHARIDPGPRLLHAALHTAGHLVEAACRAEGWTLAGSNHFPGQSRIELTPPATGAQLADAGEREKAADRLRAFVRAAIAEDLPVTADHDGDGHRVVRIGDVHAAPCGGTHVRSLADLLQVTVSAVKLKKGRIRVSYTAAHRPLR
ncbi:metal-dependent hydrolase [Nonomuraea sp. PA05]|uniref:metal-dependent hydrolase n=1 Tax=Nonomuraea sp. PA05 TaxID=2604466 RepID=UPI0011DA775C|nr:metal-dependent hydrolase [Nonomuraea sp. PA05]TYB64361.1 metal-dependent hydrolase [Nonomuraea sp. PA05]